MSANALIIGQPESRRVRGLFLALAVALCGLGAGAAAAEAGQILTLYYHEVEQNGRIYVFNTAEGQKAFEESGDVATAIVLEGRAEGGKTLVAENDTAADLYFFKHDLPGYTRETPKPEQQPFEVSWKGGKTTFKTKNAEVTLSTRIQTRFADFSSDVPNTPGAATFNIPRAKTVITGKTGAWSFKFQSNWVGQNDVVSVSTNPDGTVRSVSTRRSPELDDAQIRYQFKPLFAVWMGQGKVPFGRQLMTSGFSQQFVDRSLASRLLTPGRDQGIRIEGKNSSKTFEYAVGIYDGIARNINVNDNDEFLTSARVAWTPFGEYKLEESSFDYPDSPKLSLGAAYLDNTVGRGESAVDVSRLGYEAAFKWRGLNAVAEYFDGDAKFPDGTKDNNDGYYVQLAYLFPNKKFELAGRVGSVELESAFRLSNLGSALTDADEQGVAFSYYVDKHVQKVQADYITIEDKTTGRSLDELRFQVQVSF